MRLALPILAIAGAVDAQGLWGNAEVDAYIAANRPRPLTASSDPFATPPITPAPAAHVVLEYRVRGQNEPEGKDSLDPASWTYNPTVGVMRITIKRPPYTGSTAPPMSQGWIVFDEYIRGSSSRATNAYGASVTVTSGVSNTRGIAEVTRNVLDEPGPLPDMGNGYIASRDREYTFSYPVAPEAGRALAPHLRVQVSADTKPLRPNQWVHCRSQDYEATFSSPIEGTFNR
ncbi:MAG: hypothetical protein KJ911_12760, partial [Alphaproteobacteria bacterium]|nr:hypothetical protein [Alphaproteobacteria bacterium]